MVAEKKKPSKISIAQEDPTSSNHVSIDQSADRVTLSLASGAKATILLYGATIISWTIGSQDLLFLSSKAALDGSKPVRGGIPLVFPVFGKSDTLPDLPQHGFARSTTWNLLGRTGESDESVSVDFGLGPEALSDEMRKIWGFEFGLIYSVTLTKHSLETKMLVQNGGEKAFDFNVLFHSYFKVPDIETITIQGLEGITYKDKTQKGIEVEEKDENIKITAETDRAYKSVNGSVVVKDGDKPIFTIDKRGLDDVVIWNPYKTASKMSDFGPEDGYKNMVCVEAGSVAKWQTLEPGATWEGGVIAKAHL